MKQKLVTLLLVVAASVGTIFASTKIGDLYYNLNAQNKTAEVTYKSFTTVYNANWSIKTATIPATVTYKNVEYAVTSIGERAFFNCTSLTSVTIPNSVTSIGVSAFSYCTGLTFVSIGNSVTSIGDYAFRGCSGLTSVTIPNSVTSIGEYAFCNCSGLTSVTIPNSVTSIGDYAFDGCTGLASVTIPNSVKSIGSYAFSGCSGLTSVHISDIAAWCAINFGGFTANPLCFAHNLYLNEKLITSLVIPNSVTSIGKYAFYNCSGLNSVTMSNNVTSIGYYAFYGCSSLTSITIPNSVTNIGDWAFNGCTGLRSLLIPNGAIKIYEHVFENCPNLETVITCTDISIPNFPNSKVKRISPAEYELYLPFSQYAKMYVERSINGWQKKGEFEKTADWKKRVNDQTRQEKVAYLVKKAEQKYISGQKVPSFDLKLSNYDADNEVFAVTDPQFGTMYVAVPIADAPGFKCNWLSKKVDYKLEVKDDHIGLASMTISMPNGKKFSYRNTDAVSYNMADVEYDFEPLEINLPQQAAHSQQQGQRNITTTKVKIGKSKVDTDIPETKYTNPTTFAIIFANEDYKNVASVPFAKNDGSVFQKYCTKTLGVPVSNIHYVENASFNDIRIQLAWLKDVCNAFDGKASLIVYYAGHGIPDEATQSAYLLPVDGDSRYVQSAYKIDDLYEKLGSMNAQSVTVFMDACFSGSKRENGMLASARGVALKAKSGIPQGNMVVFSAAQGDETAYPNNEEQHGMFTYYLLKKLQETKGDVTLNELGNYISSNVRQQSIVKNGKTQTPTVIPSASLGNEWQTWKLR